MFHVFYEFQFVEIVKEFFELPYKSDNSLSFDSAFQNCAKPEWNKIKNKNEILLAWRSKNLISSGLQILQSMYQQTMKFFPR